MSTEPELPNEVERKKSSIIPVNYCKIDRAAQIVGCEPSDILHWLYCGSIDAYVFAGQTPEFHCQVFDLDRYLESLINQSTNERGVLNMAIGGISQITIRNDVDIGNMDVSGFAQGYWLIDYERYKNAYYPDFLSVISSEEKLSIKPPELEFDGLRIQIEKAVSENDIHIARDDLIRIRDAIESGKSLSVKYYIEDWWLGDEGHTEVISGTKNNNKVPVYKKQTDVIKAMFKLIPQLDEKTLNTPSVAAAQLMMLLDIDEEDSDMLRTFTRYLGGK